jgi:hypothetical protein
MLEETEQNCFCREKAGLAVHRRNVCDQLRLDSPDCEEIGQNGHQT